VKEKQNLLLHSQKEKTYHFLYEWKASIEGIRVDISKLPLRVSLHTAKA